MIGQLQRGKRYKFEAGDKYHIIDVTEYGALALVEGNDGMHFDGVALWHVPYMLQCLYKEVEK